MTREERIKNARAILDGDCSDELREALVNAFPELAESDDERIRKEIINYILYKADGVSEEQEHSWVAYLEKQKEQQPAGGSSEKPNSQWKPSDEQMEALMLAIEGKWEAILPTGYMSRRLEDLYEGLANTFGVECNLEK